MIDSSSATGRQSSKPCPRWSTRPSNVFSRRASFRRPPLAPRATSGFTRRLLEAGGPRPLRMARVGRLAPRAHPDRPPRLDLRRRDGTLPGREGQASGRARRANARLHTPRGVGDRGRGSLRAREVDGPRPRARGGCGGLAGGGRRLCVRAPPVVRAPRRLPGRGAPAVAGALRGPRAFRARRARSCGAARARPAAEGPPRRSSGAGSRARPLRGPTAPEPRRAGPPRRQAPAPRRSRTR